MKSQGHSTGSLVGKGNFCTKSSNTGTILREIAYTYKTEPSTKKGNGTPLRSGTCYVLCRYAQLWYKKPPTGNVVYHRFLFIGSRCRIELLDIGGFMGIVPRQESVFNSSMRHRELLKWHC
jgi:hypothetical protein